MLIQKVFVVVLIGVVATFVLIKKPLGARRQYNPIKLIISNTYTFAR